jgi:site-specific recombinase XerD
MCIQIEGLASVSLNDHVRLQAVDWRAIQLLLGHADLKTTQRYLNVTDEERRRTMHEKLWTRRASER